MSNQEKALAAAESTSRETALVPATGNRSNDLPPPYSLYKPSAASKPPPLPQEPPVLTRKPSPVRTNVIPGPGLQREDNSEESKSIWKNAQDLCCMASCFIWTPISKWINCCVRRCSKLKPR